jgi:hypothetical protein
MAIMSLALISSASATTVLPISEEELTKRATVIAMGVVEDVRSEYATDGSTIYTYIDVKVSRTLKGDVPDGTLKLRQLGGTVGDETVLLAGAPDYMIGEEFLIFAGPFIRTDYFGVLGIFYGRYDIGTDPSTGRKTVNGPSFSATHFDPQTHEELPRIDRPDPVYLDDFISEIRSYLNDN